MTRWPVIAGMSTLLCTTPALGVPGVRERMDEVVTKYQARFPSASGDLKVLSGAAPDACIATITALQKHAAKNRRTVDRTLSTKCAGAKPDPALMEMMKEQTPGEIFVRTFCFGVMVGASIFKRSDMAANNEEIVSDFPEDWGETAAPQLCPMLLDALLAGASKK